MTGHGPLIIAVIAMLFQQALASMAPLVLPVVAPEMSAETGLPASLIGAYSSIVYGTSFFISLGCGGYIQRYGALRVSQIALVLLGIGLLLSAPGWVFGIAVGAAIMGAGSAISTPCSTDILARLSPPAQAPLVFSLKQTGVPVGGIIVGLLIPFLALNFGWRGAFVWAAGICFAYALVLQPLRKSYDRDLNEGYGFSFKVIWQMLRRVLRHRAYRELGLTLWAYVGVQALFGSFFVTYLVQGLGYGLAEAGFVFAIAQAVSIFARVLWGWISSNFVTPRTMLAYFGIVIAISAALTGLFTKDWSIVVIALVAVLYSASAISFHGILISEIARLAPPGEVGSLSGGILSFAMLGMMSYPAIFGLTLHISEGYKLGFMLAALPALIVGIRLFFKPKASTTPP